MKKLKISFYAIIFTALGFLFSSAANAQTSQEICKTGPYQFDGIGETMSEMRPSVRRQLSALGLYAARENCSIRIVCAVRPTTEKADLDLANRESFRRCWNVRTALLFTQMKRGNDLAEQYNKEQRDAIKIGRRDASDSFPVGSTMIYLSE